MSVNRNKPHVLVLPEDNANRQIANGFQLDVSSRQIQVLPETGGWIRVLECFTEDQIWAMDRFPERFMILLIDFDNKEARLQGVKAKIPSHLTERVFVLGVLSEPEDLKKDLQRYTRRSARISQKTAALEQIISGLTNFSSTTPPNSSVCATRSAQSCFPSPFSSSYTSPSPSS